jgi:hypothetical protein
VVLLFGLACLYPAATFGAKDMNRPKSRSAHLAGKLDATLEMLNDYRALLKVYILGL